ncbi:hypothetical protein ACFQGS_22985 [Novosphingobium lubricantis]
MALPTRIASKAASGTVQSTGAMANSGAAMAVIPAARAAASVAALPGSGRITISGSAVMALR